MSGAFCLSNQQPPVTSGHAPPVRVGTAGWTIPAAVREAFPADGTALERYAARFGAAEINSTFHRSHRAATFARWAASVPASFRFAVKLPKTITHTARLRDCATLLDQFVKEVAPLAAVRGPTLVQLPPSLAFEAEVAARFFAQLAETVGGTAVCEPRHHSWFEPAAERLLDAHRVARVAADPATVPGAGSPGGWRGIAYYRLHGSPRVYWSAYDRSFLEHVAGEVRRLRDEGAECWVVFDNTAGSAAAANALELADLLE